MFFHNEHSPWLIHDSEKDRELADLDDDASAANRNLQAAETLVSTLDAQLKQKGDDLKSMV